MSQANQPLELDATELRCPLPIIKLAKFAKDLAPGTVIEVAVTDPAAQFDIPAWARMRGHTSELTSTPAPGTPRFTVTVTLA